MKNFKQIFKTLMVLVLAFTVLFQTANISSALTHYPAFTVEGIKVPLSGYSHGAKTFNNGFYQNPSSFYVRSATYDGAGLMDAVYCIEPGAPIKQKNMTQDTNMSYLKSIPHKATTQAQKEELLSAVFTYGENRGYASVCDESAATLNAWYTKYVATQLLLWEVITEDRGANFKYLNNKYTVISLLDDFSATAKKEVLAQYNAYVDAIVNSYKKPDFGATSFTLEFEDGMYTKTLTDKNKVVSNFNISCSNPLVTATTKNNTVTFSSEYPITSALAVTLTRKIPFNDVGYYIGKDNVDTQAFGKAIDKTRKIEITTTVNFGKNDSGGIQIQKVSSNSDFTKNNSNYSLAGAVFEISNEDGSIRTIETNANGIASTGNLLPYGTYTIKEIVAPKGYLLNTNTFTATINAQSPVVSQVSVAQVTVADDPKGGVIQVSKKDSETGDTPQGSATLAGAIFEIKDSDDKVVDTITTDSDFIATSKLLPFGTYTVIEKVAPNGYKLNTKSERVTLSETNSSVTLNTLAIKDDVIKGRVVITKLKTSVLPENLISPKTPFEGVKFTLKNTNTGEVFNATATATDSEGKIYFEDIPYGTYKIVEEIPAGYTASRDFTVTITQDNQLVEVEIENVAQNKTLKIEKHTKGDINIANITFEISGTTLDGQHFFASVTTDELGHAVIKLPIGEYSVKELASEANQYYDIPDPKNIKLQDDTTITFYNIEKKANVSLKKFVQGIDFEYSLGSGIEFNLAGISDAGYKVDITLATDLNGECLFADIPIGTYTLTEIANDRMEHLVLLEPAVVEIKDSSTINLELLNNVKTSSIVVTKTQFGRNDILVADAEYTLFTSDGEAIKSLKTDADGQCIFDNVPFGDYIIKETIAPVGYMLNPVEYKATIKNNGEIISILTEDELILTDIVVSKQSKTTGEYLSGTEFTLFTKDGETVIDVAVTDETGFATFYDVPYGDYVIKETNPPIGYANDSAPMYFALDDAFEVETVFAFANSPLPQTGVDSHSNTIACALLFVLGLLVLFFDKFTNLAKNSN